MSVPQRQIHLGLLLLCIFRSPYFRVRILIILYLQVINSNSEGMSPLISCWLITDWVHGIPCSKFMSPFSLIEFHESLWNSSVAPSIVYLKIHTGFPWNVQITSLQAFLDARPNELFKNTDTARDKKGLYLNHFSAARNGKDSYTSLNRRTGWKEKLVYICVLSKFENPKNHVWLVVYLALWKIWLRQLGWWHSQYIEK